MSGKYLSSQIDNIISILLYCARVERSYSWYSSEWDPIGWYRLILTSHLPRNEIHKNIPHKTIDLHYNKIELSN